MKKYLYIMTVMALGAIACSREEQPASDGNTQFASGQDMMTIIACTESSDTTKTALLGDDTNGYDVIWSEGDEIKIGSETFTLTSGAGTTRGTFTGPALSDGSYVAYYATTNGLVPMTQYYTAGRITNAPMQAPVTVTAGEASIANFTNIGGLLRLTIKKVKAATIGSITLDVELSNTESRMILDCSSSPVALTEAGSEFYIAMPEGTYTKFSVELTTTDGKTMTKKLSQGKSLVITPSQITNATFKTNTLNGHEFVDLGLSSGLLWATCNIGAGSPDEVGTYFAWGETAAQEDMQYSWKKYKHVIYEEGKTNIYIKYNESDGKLTLESDDDAACQKWKDGWRMPTKIDYEELIENCYWEWSHNFYTIGSYSGPYGWFVFKAKENSHKGVMCDSNSTNRIEGYSRSDDPHIFLPATNRICEGESKVAESQDCYYWTSSLRPGNWFQSFHFAGYSLNRSIGYCSRNYGMPIRAVCE